MEEDVASIQIVLAGGEARDCLDVRLGSNRVPNISHKPLKSVYF